MLLRSFWYHLHANLITTSTAGVCYYPQDMGALTTLDMRSNHIPPKRKEDIRRICAAGGIQIAM
jgi:hypothetical protein